MKHHPNRKFRQQNFLIRCLYTLLLPHTRTCTHSCLRRNTLTADNLYIADITSTGESRVSFNLYARLDGGTISGSALVTAVLVRVSPCYTIELLLIIMCGWICHNLNLPPLYRITVTSTQP